MAEVKSDRRQALERMDRREAQASERRRPV